MKIGYYILHIPYNNQLIFNNAKYLRKYDHAGAGAVAYHLALRWLESTAERLGMRPCEDEINKLS
ncbi:hypothetical protein KAU51_04745 [Candidatus Parcubacteria bacterium]|nr:hypothetical protein [Candidatus Parcubacteria bacterium]